MAQLKAVLAPLGEEMEKKATDYNLLIRKVQGKADEVAIRYRLSEKHLTADEFPREYNTGASKEDFLAYMLTRIEERYRLDQISHSTYIKHHSTLNKLREFAAADKDCRPGAWGGAGAPLRPLLMGCGPRCGSTRWRAMTFCFLFASAGLGWLDQLYAQRWTIEQCF